MEMESWVGIGMFVYKHTDTHIYIASMRTTTRVQILILTIVHGNCKSTVPSPCNQIIALGFNCQNRFASIEQSMRDKHALTHLTARSGRTDCSRIGQPRR